MAEDALEAERALAAARGEQYAEVLDIGVPWNSGAPIPHVLANGSRAFVVCYVGEPDPSWDGTSVRVIAPDTVTEDLFGVVEFWGCASVRLGAPNDEALSGHPLYRRGLQAYAAHEVHNSPWLEEHIRMNSVRSQQPDAVWRRLHHYILVFHDEVFEALAAGIEGQLVRSSMEPLLHRLAREVVEHPSRREGGKVP